MTGFLQDPPRLSNPWDADPWLRAAVARRLPAEVWAEIAPGLHRLGERAATDLAAFAADAEAHPPRHVPFDGWGRRIDRVETSPGWQALRRAAAEEGIVATAYERRHGAFSRLHQLARLVLYHPSSAIFSCPLAMTDGTARTLELLGDAEQRDRYLPRLTSRDPARFWTAGQWMTERAGGSDVGNSETVATALGSGSGFRLSGTKWFTSAIEAEIALTLGRLEGAPGGSEGLSLFLVELGPAAERGGGLNGIRLLRLKDKLGTRALPTAELELDGCPAALVGGPGHGVRKIASVLNVTRLYNAACAVGTMRRAVQLACDYATRRRAFGRLLRDLPLHVETLAGIAVEVAGATELVTWMFEICGRVETGSASAEDETVLRVLTPVAKLFTGKQAVAVASEALEAFGGAGYVEDSGLPWLLRDAQVLPIWEGTTNVLSLDTLRALGKGGALEAIAAEVETCCASATDPGLGKPVEVARAALRHATAWVQEAMPHPTRLEAGARRFAMTLGRTLELALLCQHAQWALDHKHGPRLAAAARRLAHNGIDQIGDASFEDAQLLA